MSDQAKIHVMVVDDIAETRENIRRSLQFDQQVEVVGTARSGAEAIELAFQLKPDVIVMDINMPDMDGISATEQIRRKLPYVQVVILSVQNDPSYMRRAMLVGARDFLTKPPSIDELIAAIRRAGKMASDERSKAAQNVGVVPPGNNPSSAGQGHGVGKVIVVYSPKGGNGTTFLSTNLALGLQTEENKVILVDGNMQYGDIAICLNEQVKNYVYDLTTRADELDPDIIMDVATKHKTSNLRILAAPPKPEMADKVVGEQFGKLLQYLKLVFNYVIVDTASYLSDVVQSALEVADLIVLVTTQDIPSIKNCNLFLGIADASGINRQNIIFVMNRYDKRIGISPERVGENLHQPILLSIPFDDKLVVTTSINRGMPLMTENRAHPVAKGILSLAEMIKEKCVKLDSPIVEPVQAHKK